MDWLTNLLWHGGKFLGTDWTPWIIFWNIIGWSGNAVFSSRFLVQWYATEKKKQVVVPTLFWWLSLVGSLLLLSFALFYDKHYVVIFAYAFTWIPVHPEFDHPSPIQGGTPQLSAMWQGVSAAVKFLLGVRRAAGGGYFLGLGAGVAAGTGAVVAGAAAVGCGTRLYFFRTCCWKSGWVWP